MDTAVPATLTAVPIGEHPATVKTATSEQSNTDVFMGLCPKAKTRTDASLRAGLADASDSRLPVKIDKG